MCVLRASARYLHLQYKVHNIRVITRAKGCGGVCASFVILTGTAVRRVGRAPEIADRPTAGARKRLPSTHPRRSIQYAIKTRRAQDDEGAGPHRPSFRRAGTRELYAT